MGHQRVYAFLGGIPEWRKFNLPMTIDAELQKIRVPKLPPVEMQRYMTASGAYILDVRPLDFRKEPSFVPGAVHCPLVKLETFCAMIPKDRDIVIMDWAMKQSPTAAKFLIRRGYTVHGVLKGGIERWRASGLPVETRTSAASVEE
jgi:rhodanese-related sulfurtransferase